MKNKFAKFKKFSFILMFILSTLINLNVEILLLTHIIKVGLAIYFSIECIIQVWAAGADAKF